MTAKATQPDAVPWRLQIAVYGIGLFSTSMFYMASVVVPLWVASIETSPFLVGVVLSARHFLPLFLSIHGGALMDRLGGRRVMIFFAIVGIVVPLLFPVMPWIWAVLVLQMIAGLADSMGWLGAQTLIGQHMRGSTVYTGRLSFTCRFGHLIAPPAIGWVWDVFGPTWAFVGLSVWGLGTLVCGLMLPDNTGNAADENSSRSPTNNSVRFRDALPRFADYVAAFRLLGIPAIALIVMASMLSHVGSSVQSTFYVVYLEKSYSATEIGLLFSAASVAAALGALAANWTAQRIKPYWMIMGTILSGVLAIALTPLFGFLSLLMIAASVRGAANGMSQPMVISSVLKVAGPAMQGKAAGIRGTMNRVASIVAPMVMGAMAEFIGMETSFFVVGAIVTILMGALVVHVMRSPELTASNRIPREDEAR
ncbi:MAG: MFS transporter [Rhodospirillaceae bacterium]|nr:MFS transporter [Rhodospirillaceae bacterium]MBT5455176.1 MFS transporter [Rhodospirillaceae bacterium]